MITSQSESRTAPLAPTGRERRFDLDELFFSTTDAKGIITSGNSVFARVSAYELEDMVGRPHNLIRHPDMPRGAFKLVWEYLQAGRPVAAYVVNLAADGGHYWVLAYLAPIDGGYLSIRLKPDSLYFDAARRIYEELRAFEREHERDLARRKDVIAASRDRLVELLAEEGFDSYDAFMQAALPAEVAHRSAQLAVSAKPGEGGVAGRRLEPQARRILGDCARAEQQVEAFAAQLRSWSSATEQLQRHGAMMRDVSSDIELFSLNAQIASTRLGDAGRTLLAVAGLLTAASLQLRPAIEEQVERIAEAAGLLGGAGALSFAAAVSRLQLDVLATFVGSDVEGDGRIDDTRLLGAALQTGVMQLAEQVEALDVVLARVELATSRVRTGMAHLRALEVNGRIESARVEHASALGAMFVEIGGQVRAAAAALAAIDGGAVADTSAVHHVLRTVRGINECVAA